MVRGEVYEPQPGKVVVDYSQRTNVRFDPEDTDNNRVWADHDTDEKIVISQTPGEYDPENSTPRVIDYQRTAKMGECDVIPQDESDWETCPGGENEQAGIIRHYDVGAAFDGRYHDMAPWDKTEEVYKGTDSGFFITLDLGQERTLSNIALSLKAVGGSDAAHRYRLLATNGDPTSSETRWETLANTAGNLIPGFQAHDFAGKAKTYRYVKFQNSGVHDVVHNNEAAWARGLYEMTIRADKIIPLDVSALESAVAEGTTLVAMTDKFTMESFAGLKEELAVADQLLQALRTEGESTTHTQAEVDAAAKSLVNAIQHLVGIGQSPDPEPTDKPTEQPTAEPTDPGDVDIYTTPGFHNVNGRHWMTVCEPYSELNRCWTYIWGTQIHRVNDAYAQVNHWVFNNLTYTASPRALWKNNPLGNTGEWTAEDGRRWRTECDTAVTGRNGCRSYAEASVVEATSSGYRTETKFVFNNMVRFS